VIQNIFDPWFEATYPNHTPKNIIVIEDGIFFDRIGDTPKDTFIDCLITLPRLEAFYAQD